MCVCVCVCVCMCVCVCVCEKYYTPIVLIIILCVCAYCLVLLADRPLLSGAVETPRGRLSVTGSSQPLLLHKQRVHHRYSSTYN